MKLNDYQKEALSTAVYGSGDKIIYPTLGLAGEAGEVADKVKKVLIHMPLTILFPEYHGCRALAHDV